MTDKEDPRIPERLLDELGQLAHLAKESELFATFSAIAGERLAQYQAMLWPAVQERLQEVDLNATTHRLGEGLRHIQDRAQRSLQQVRAAWVSYLQEIQGEDTEIVIDDAFLLTHGRNLIHRLIQAMADPTEGDTGAAPHWRVDLPSIMALLWTRPTQD